MKEPLESIYNEVSKKYNLGTFDAFSSGMQDSSKRRIFYDYIGDRYNLPDYESFELLVSSPEPFVNTDDVFFNEESPPAPQEAQVPQRNERIDALIKGLEENKNNPQYVMRALDNPDPEKRISKLIGQPKFVMGIPTSAIFPDQGQAIGSDIPPMAEEVKRLEDQRKELGLPFTPDSKDVARFFNKKMLHQEMSKEMKAGKSPKQAYNAVFSKVGGTPPNIVNLGMENSVTGSVFRSIGLEQDVDVSDYPASRLEHMASSAISMVMPVDAALFAFGGQLGKVKQVGKYADEAANLLAKRTSMTLP